MRQTYFVENCHRIMNTVENVCGKNYNSSIGYLNLLSGGNKNDIGKQWLLRQLQL